MKKKIVVFSGAGISRESGVLTFRDSKNGLWNSHKIDDVATPEGWKRNYEKVLNFYNERRNEMPNVEPNEAHISLASLEEEYDVTIVTQNVDDLHERGGSSDIIHLHGELTKARSSDNPNAEPIDIGYDLINVGDKADDGSQLRPHIVWFSEYPFEIERAFQVIREADILIIVGTSLQIGYTLTLLNEVRHDGDGKYSEKTVKKEACEIYYVDPEPMEYLSNSYGLQVNYIRRSATEGIYDLVNVLIERVTGKISDQV